MAIPFVLSGPMCFANNTLAISEVLSTIFFMSGVVTLLQTTFGVRFVSTNFLSTIIIISDYQNCPLIPIKSYIVLYLFRIKLI